MKKEAREMKGGGGGGEEGRGQGRRRGTRLEEIEEKEMERKKGG